MLVKEFIEKYPSSEQVLKSAKQFEELLVEGKSILIVDGRPLVLRIGDAFLPSLKFEEIVDMLPQIVVDMGAVAHVANGSHIMRPGITEIRGVFGKGDLVVILDEKFGKTIALGRAEADSGVMKSVTKGRVISNLHYVGDVFWESFAALGSR